MDPLPSEILRASTENNIGNAQSIEISRPAKSNPCHPLEKHNIIKEENQRINISSHRKSSGNYTKHYPRYAEELLRLYFQQ